MSYPFRRCCDTPVDPKFAHLPGCSMSTWKPKTRARFETFRAAYDETGCDALASRRAGITVGVGENYLRMIRRGM